MALPTE